jgi:hypothetical protein
MKITNFLAVITTFLFITNPIFGICSTEFNEFSSGDWTGGVIKDDDGNFSHCYVTAQYESGFYFGIGLTGDYAINLVLSHQEWELPLGETHIVSLSIDGKNLGLFEAYSVDRKGLRIEIGNQQYIYKRLRFGRRLVVSAQKQDFYFSLKGTNKALTKVRECVRCFKIMDGKIE